MPLIVFENKKTLENKMVFETDILIIHVAGNDDEQGISWTQSLARNVKSAIGQISNKEPNVANITITNESIENKVKSAKIIAFIFNKLATPEHLSKVIDIHSHANELQQVKLIFTKPFKYSELGRSLKNKPYYLFYDNDSETSLLRHFSENEEGNASRLYWSKMLDLSADLKHDLLTDKPAQKTIYLAETTPEHYENRDAVKRELLQRGFKVVPSHLIIGNLKEQTEQIFEYLNQSIMSVHLIGNYSGEILTGSDISLLDLQCQLAAKRWRLSSGKDTDEIFQRLVWLQPGLKPADERQRRFVNSLRLEDKDSYFEIIQAPIEELKSVIRQRLKLFNTQLINIAENYENSVYLICEQNHVDEIEAITKILNNKGCNVLNVDFNRQPDTILATHNEYLNKASSVIICDFNCPEQWMNSKLKDLLKAPGNGRIMPFQSKAIATKQVSKYTKLKENNDYILFDANQISEKTFEPFLKKINKR
jgi:hypothetical protein